MKICSKCKEEKELSEFHMRTDRPGTPRPECKVCTRNKDNTDAKRTKARGYQQTPNAKYYKYKYYAEKRNYEWNLSEEEFKSFWQRPCYYCGDAVETVGLDRIDNDKGYEINNVVSCCSFCNTAKNKWSSEYFFDKIHKIARRHNG